MEPKWNQKGIRKSMFFWLGFWEPLETSTERRGSVEGASGERRVSVEGHTFSSGSPRAAPYYQRILLNNNPKQAWLEDLARLEPLARRIILEGSASVSHRVLEFGGWPLVLVPRLYHRKAPSEKWDIGDLSQKQEVNGVSHFSHGDVFEGKGGRERMFMKNVEI